jgi:hypothetical protein
MDRGQRLHLTGQKAGYNHLLTPLARDPMFKHHFRNKILSTILEAGL